MYECNRFRQLNVRSCLGNLGMSPLAPNSIQVQLQALLPVNLFSLECQHLPHSPIKSSILQPALSFLSWKVPDY